MKHYYEIDDNGYLTAFDDIETAIEYADRNGCSVISEIGGNWTDFEKCWFCGEWFDVCELNKEELCKSCELALWSRGEYQK